jgi:hypothetical protein
MDEITRSTLPAVVKRAAELAAAEGDPEETISEDEVIRIAAELGLAEHHVRQALYEGVVEPEPESLLDKQMGVPRIMATRAVPFPPEGARRALEDYFVTREYLQIVRRQSKSTTFERADDAVSKVARKLSRSRKHCLASAEAVEVTLRELQPGWTHVRLKAVYPDHRKSHLIGAGIGSVVLGVPLAAVTTATVGAFFPGAMLGDPLSIAVGAAAGITAFAATTAGLFTSARNNYRRWRERTVVEADSILDRLEKGDELRPPPAPWIRKLQLKFGQL